MEKWRKQRELRNQRAARAREWERRRAYLGLPRDREVVAPQLGLSLRTLQRFEFSEPPAWYDLALVGLAVKVREQKKQKA